MNTAGAAFLRSLLPDSPIGLAVARARRTARLEGVVIGAALATLVAAGGFVWGLL